MSQSSQRYTGRDIAFVVPTMNRPEKIKDLFESLVQQTEPCGVVIVVDGGQSIKDVVHGFSDRLNIEHVECQPPGQIRQKNMGISLLNKRTPLVGYLDDDIVLEPRAIEKMVAFWNACEEQTAGVSFNIVNVPPERASQLSCMLGFSAREPGRVLRSGITTSISHVSGSVRTEWVCGGATVWRRQVLEQFPHREIASRWAIGEDIIYSYPIGKQFPLYVCAPARVRHEHVTDYVPAKAQDRFHGFTQTLWLLYFIESNENLSRSAFLGTLLVKIVGKAILGTLTLQSKHVKFAMGQLEGILIGSRALIRGRDIATVLVENAER
jgi:glycosyltransferase involved in cell wall biosynthesis